MEMPKLKFKFNPDSDFNIVWEFYNNPKQEGVDFWLRGALRHHDDLINIKHAKNKKDFLCDYVSSLYALHLNEFEKQKKEIMVLYKHKESLFFYETNKIFKNYPWPKGEYIAYLSIFDFCPRFLADKTFFVFMYDNDSGILFTIFHEMLHFIFYDYCLTKYPRIFKGRNTETGPFWELAELFNLVLQNTSVFSKLHGQINKIGYPKLKSEFNLAKKAWHGDIDKWIIKFGSSYIKRARPN